MINRRQLLTAASLLSVAPSAIGKTTLDIQSFGARGDGKNDDADAIQHAIEAAYSAGGGTVRVPRRNVERGEYWRLSRPLLLKSRVSLVGDGPESLLYNDRRESTTFMDQAVVLPGNYHPQFLNNLMFNQATISNDRTVAFVDNIKGRYSAGQTVFIRSADFDVSRAEFSISSITVICQVIRAEIDRVHLDRSIHFDGPLVIAPSDGEIDWRAVGPPTRCFVSMNSSIQNLAIRSHGFWIGDSAARGCKFSNLWIESRVGVYGNLFQDCHWNEINLAFDRFAIELSCNSSDVVVENLKARMTSDPDVPNHQIIAVQESANRCSINNFAIDASVFRQTGAVVRFGPSSHCSLSHGRIQCEQARGAMISFDTGASQVDHNFVRDVTFYAGSGAVGIAFEPRQSGNVSNNQADGVRIEGLSTGVAARIGGYHNVISASHLTGRRVVVLPGAKNCTVSDSTIPDSISFPTPAIDTATVRFLRNNARH